MSIPVGGEGEHHVQVRSEQLSGRIVNDLSAELKQQKVDVTRWGKKAEKFSKLKVGMSAIEVKVLLGTRDINPKDNLNIWQYYPDNFRGGLNGDYWNLDIHFKNVKISGFQLLKVVYGPPRG